MYDVCIQKRREVQAAEFLNSAVAAGDTFANERFDEVGDGIVFWYSTRTEDSYHVLNITAMLVGQLQRLSRYVTSLKSRQFSQLADRGALYILAHQQKSADGHMFWLYLGDKQPAEMYTFQGLLEYKAHAGRYGHLIDARALLSSIHRFMRGQKVYEFPTGYAYPAHLHYVMERPARLWGIGYAIYVSARLEAYLSQPPDLSRQLADALLTSYQRNGRWLMRPGDNQDAPYPRQLAHVLLGLALLESRGPN